MGHSQAAKAESREKVLRITARRIREEGMARPGVADLMKEAGLTHGGFYKHFTSRDDLMAQAAALALADGEDKMAEAARRDPVEPRSGLIDAYLSARHRDAPGTGCALVTLGASAGRGDEALKESYEVQVRKYLALIGEAARGDAPEAESEADAMLTLSALVGALLISRAVADPGLSDRILTAVAGRLKDLGAHVPAEA